MLRGVWRDVILKGSSGKRVRILFLTDSCEKCGNRLDPCVDLQLGSVLYYRYVYFVVDSLHHRVRTRKQLMEPDPLFPARNSRVDRQGVSDPLAIYWFVVNLDGMYYDQMYVVQTF